MTRSAAEMRRRDCPERLTSDWPLPPTDQVPHADAIGRRELLYDAEAPRLRRYFARRGAPTEAADLAHDVFVRLFGVSAAGPLERPTAYISRIAGNLLKDRARTAIRRSDALHVPIDHVTLVGPDPHLQLEARDMLRRLENAVSHLKPLTREIFLAHRIDGFSYAEIAERTGLSIKGVEKHMSRAIAKIDRLMSGTR